MHCTKCGVAIDGGVKFCPSCGAEQRFDAYGVSPAAMAATAPPPADSYYSAVIGPKNQHYYLHCKAGVRSLKALNFLRQQGFKYVKSVKGGISAWAEEIDRNVPRY